MFQNVSLWGFPLGFPEDVLEVSREGSEELPDIF